MSAIYTRQGDFGRTCVGKDGEMSKASLYPKACGYLDELNVAIGWVKVAYQAANVKQRLHEIQKTLFKIPTVFTCKGMEPKPVEPDVFFPLKIKELEDEIDEIDTRYTPLKNFIVPGKNELSIRWHMARVVCRHAERVLVELSNEQPIPKGILAYMNRLSDWLFMYAYEAEMNNN